MSTSGNIVENHETLFETNLVYFAHPYKMYNTSQELRLIQQIENLYPDYKIINPKDLLVPYNMRLTSWCERKVFLDNEMEIMRTVFFPKINQCKVFAYYESSAWGVKQELTYAQQHKKIIIELREN